MQQNDTAWSILTRKGAGQRDIAFAQKLAERASQGSGGTNAGILDTLARAQFMSGLTNEAIATEQQAASLAPRADQAKFEEVLVKYRQGKLPDEK
jgi:hypothetical protein